MGRIPRYSRVHSIALQFYTCHVSQLLAFPELLQREIKSRKEVKTSFTREPSGTVPNGTNPKLVRIGIVFAWKQMEPFHCVSICNCFVWFL